MTIHHFAPSRYFSGGWLRAIYHFITFGFDLLEQLRRAASPAACHIQPYDEISRLRYTHSEAVRRKQYSLPADDNYCFRYERVRTNEILLLFDIDVPRYFYFAIPTSQAVRRDLGAPPHMPRFITAA